jgi:hypothetical protein
MKRTKFTELTTVLMMTALCALPLAGQEKVAVKMESAVRDGVQLRADDADALPDSAIRYAPDGQRQAKYVYAGENRGTYTWENNAWLFESAEANTSIFRSSTYNQENDVNNRHAITFGYRIIEERLLLDIPMGIGTHLYYTFSPYTNFKPEYDVHGNLIFIQIVCNGVYFEYTANFNTENNPVSIEGGYHDDDRMFFKAHYEYNDFGYPTLSETYNWNSEKEIWESNSKQTVNYDMQGRMLNRINYDGDEINSILSCEYYDEHHYSSRSYENSLDESNNWKWEYKYGADGKLGARYNYRGGELSEYYIFYPNTLDNPGNANEPLADMRIWSYGGTLHVRTAQPVVLHVYTLTGALHARQTLHAGETVLPLPPGIYVVRIGNAVRKAVIR